MLTTTIRAADLAVGHVLASGHTVASMYPGFGELALVLVDENGTTSRMNVGTETTVRIQGTGDRVVSTPNALTLKERTFAVDHAGHDVRRMWRTDGTGTAYLFCRTCNRSHG